MDTQDPAFHVEYGIQGGYHVDVSLRFTGDFNPDRVDVRMELELLDISSNPQGNHQGEESQEGGIHGIDHAGVDAGGTHIGEMTGGFGEITGGLEVFGAGGSEYLMSGHSMASIQGGSSQDGSSQGGDDIISSFSGYGIHETFDWYLLFEDDQPDTCYFYKGRVFLFNDAGQVPTERDVKVMNGTSARLKIILTHDAGVFEVQRTGVMRWYSPADNGD